MADPIRCSSLGGIMRCRAYKKISKAALDVGSDAANFGTAFAESQKQRRLGAVVDFDQLQAQFGLTTDELDEIKRLPYRINRDFTDWTLAPEHEYAITAKFEPCRKNDPRAVLTGHPDVVAFHRTFTHVAQVIDDKTGQQEVLDSWQLIAYIMLVMAHNSDITLVDGRYDYYRLGFSSGRIDANGAPRPFTREEITGKYWPAFLKALAESRCRVNVRFTKGVQCDRCAKWACPAWSEERRMLADSDSIIVPNLTAESSMAEKAAFVIDWLAAQKLHQRIADELEGMLKSIGQQISVDLGNGTYYGDKPQERRAYDGKKTLPKLLAAFKGDAALLGDVLGKFSKTDIASVVKHGVDAGFLTGKKGALIDQFLADLKKDNAELVAVQHRVSVYASGAEAIGEVAE